MDISALWTQLGNDLRAGHITLKMFYASLHEDLPPLRHIHLETVSVLDHLGQTMPVPSMFCCTWEVILHLHYIDDLTHLNIPGL